MIKAWESKHTLFDVPSCIHNVPMTVTFCGECVPPPQSRPKLRVVDPLDYEGELNSRRKDLEKEQYLNLLLFPQQDITVCVYAQSPTVRTQCLSPPLDQ